jgi:hypothetical protein
LFFVLFIIFCVFGRGLGRSADLAMQKKGTSTARTRVQAATIPTRIILNPNFLEKIGIKNPADAVSIKVSGMIKNILFFCNCGV